MNLLGMPYRVEDVRPLAERGPPVETQDNFAQGESGWLFRDNARINKTVGGLFKIGQLPQFSRSGELTPDRSWENGRREGPGTPLSEALLYHRRPASRAQH